MMENRQNLNNNFNGQANIAKVESNATDGLNLQTLDSSPEDLNRQIIEASALAQNKQLIEGDSEGANRQQLDVDAFSEHNETFDPEIRAQNIQEVIGQVNKKLDHFERSNMSFLAIGRAQKFTDDFVPIQEDASGTHRLLVDASFARMGLASLSYNLAEPAGPTAATEKRPTESTARDNASTNASASTRTDGSFSQDIVFPAPQPAGLRLYLGQASLMQRGFNVTYKQIAVALATLAFASPIYTQSTKSRVAVGSLVTVQQLAPELLEQRQALESVMTEVQQSR
jgi:hypothetical protein